MRIERGNFYVNGHFFDYALIEGDKIIMVCSSKELLELFL